MAKGDKYKALKKYLEGNKLPLIKLSFKQIEEIIGDTLPDSAYKHSESWWSNSHESSQATAWLEAGYETDCVTDTYEKKMIIFRKL